MSETYLGVKPHVDNAVSNPVISGRVLANATMQRLNHSLTNADDCRREGRFDNANTIMETAALFLEEIDGLHAAAHAAFDDVASRLSPPIPVDPPDDADSDEKPKRKSK